MNRRDAQRQGNVFHTGEMVDWLRAVTGVSEELVEALLGAWVGGLRADALRRAEQDLTFLSLLQQGKVQSRCPMIHSPYSWVPTEATRAPQ